MSEEKFKFFYRGPFSQWKMQDFTVDGVTYNCAEQYMMRQKALLFGDEEAAKEIMKADHPSTQKEWGRNVKNFKEKTWNEKARDIVYKGNWHKFKQSPDLLKSLKNTAGTTLVEASPKDKIWGIGLAATDDRCQSRETWLGTNWLGEVLTKVRDDLIAGIYRTKDFNWSKLQK
jgi:ribA/ribD-fused uncharacterized protein